MSDENAPPETDDFIHVDDEELGEEVLAYIEKFIHRVTVRMLAAPDPEEAVAAFVATLREDAGTMQLLANAIDEGRRDAMFAAAKFADADGPSTTWEGVEGGERGVLWQEGHVCNGCAHAEVCVVQRTIPAEMLVQVRRCLAFKER